MRNTIIKAAVYVFFFAAGVFLGLTLPRVQTPAANEEKPAVMQGSMAESAAQPLQTPVPAEEYIVSASKGRLCLFKVSSDEVTLIKSADISEQLYPSSDIKRLEDGIRASTEPEAMEIWENYIG